MEETEKKILIVDDNPKNIQLLAKLLSDNGYSIETVMSGAEALFWINEDNFDLVLLDIMMPEMDGFEVCDKIKANPENSDLPVIFLTAKTDVESLTTAFEKGGWDYLTKPFNSEELLARVRTHIDLKKAKERLKDVNQWLEAKVGERTKELKKSNKELAQAKAELELLDNAKNEFLKILSHEIRTPLNGIMGGLELLKLVELPKETEDFIYMLDESISRLEAFSIKALDISQIRIKGADVIIPDQIFALHMVNDCIDGLIEKIEEKKITIVLTGIPDTLFFIGDKYFIKKCFSNILSNSINFSPENGKVTIDTIDENGKVSFIIKDNGPGFPAVVQNTIFNPFVLGEDHMDKFTGLGLNLVKLIMEIHSGDISISNGTDGGAIVSLTFNKELPKP
ncbi:MAG: hybrid sensor histidine kinase/response regulator [Bacteroidetes bacterium]|nr:hybrid sensor histidine kinase/response regulator [Bacteroidota bacterium]